MIINIIDRDFNFLGQIDNYESLIQNKKWHGIGVFELHLHEDTQYVDKLQKESIIFTSVNKAYVILFRSLKTVDGRVIIKGLELKSYFKRWIIFPPIDSAYYRINSNVETIMKAYVQATLDRKGIANITVAENKNRGITTIYQSRYKNLAEELEKLSLASGLGWDITLDLENKQFVFDVIDGKDLSFSQSKNPPAIFSVEYDNIAEQELIESKLDYANTAIVAGQGEGVDRIINIIGDNDKGLDSFELFVDARDLENENDLPSRGRQKLTEMEEIFTFDSQVLADQNLIYEQDFNLGDITTISNKKWNIEADRRIVGVTEVYESAGFRLDVVFGEGLPSIVEKIKKVVDAPIAEGGGSGEPGEPGKPGTDGVGIQFIWDGKKLGVKREDEVDYQYSNLEGKQGPEGPQGLIGLPGLNGKSIDFHWDGTSLGVRIEGQPSYQYVDLKGDQGPQGLPGKDGADGANGKSIEFHWNGVNLGLRLEGQTNYQYVNLKGDTGPKGDPGIGIPAGGLTGQVLQKKSGTNYDMEWVNAPSGGTTIITSISEPTGLNVGDQWHRTY